MNRPSNQQLCIVAACSMLFLTGFRNASLASVPESNIVRVHSADAAAKSAQHHRGFSFEYNGLFYFKLSMQAGKGSEGFLLDIQTNETKP